MIINGKRKVEHRDSAQNIDEISNIQKVENSQDSDVGNKKIKKNMETIMKVTNLVTNLENQTAQQIEAIIEEIINNMQKVENSEDLNSKQIPYHDYVGHAWLRKEEWNLDPGFINGNLTKFDDQVAGHSLDFLVFDNYLLKAIKKEKPTSEFAFYIAIKNAKNTKNQDDNVLALREISKFMPYFHGTYKININEKIQFQKCICLENICNSFTNPSMMDLKMGMITCFPSASLEKKKKRLRKWPLQLELGYRVTGMKIYDRLLGHSKRYYKDFRRHTTCNHVYNALLLYLGALSIQDYDKSFENEGLQKVQQHRIGQAKIVAQGIIKELKSILCWFKTHKSYRFYCSSLLIGYEFEKDETGTSSTQLSAGTTKLKLKVCMIDFAHVFYAPNAPHGDENYIHGLKNLIKIFETLL